MTSHFDLYQPDAQARVSLPLSSLALRVTVQPTVPVAKNGAFGEDHGTLAGRRNMARWLPLTTTDGSMAEYSKHQQNIIKRYYENKEAISLQRLSELVTELYLAEGKARTRAWKNIIAALEKLKVPKSRIDHLVKQDNPALVAKLVEELLAKK